MSFEVYDWPDRTKRAYLPVVWPHCLLSTRQLRSERYQFADLHALLSQRAYWLFASAEALTLLSECDEDRIGGDLPERVRREVRDNTEMVRQIAWAAGYGREEAEVWVTRAIMTGRAIGQAVARGEQPEVETYYPMARDVR